MADNFSEGWLRTSLEAARRLRLFAAGHGFGVSGGACPILARVLTVMALLNREQPLPFSPARVLPLCGEAAGPVWDGR